MMVAKFSRPCRIGCFSQEHQAEVPVGEKHGTGAPTLAGAFSPLSLFVSEANRSTGVIESSWLGGVILLSFPLGKNG